MGEHAGQLGVFTGEKHTLARHENIVEYDESLRRVVARRHRKVALVLMPRCIRGVDDLHARSADRHHTGNRILLFAGAHRLGRYGQKLVTHRCGGNVQFGAADDDAVAALLDDPYVGIRIVLITGAPTAVALGIGDALGDTYVALLSILHPRANAFGSLRKGCLNAIGGGQQRHDRRISHVRQQVDGLVQLNLISQFLGRPGNRHEGTDCAGGWVVKTIIAGCGRIDRDP